MTEVQERTVDALNDVLSEDLNAVRAYQEASENIEEPRLRSVVDDLLQERTVFVRELHEQVKSLGGEPVKDEDLGGSLRGTWMNLQSSLSGGDGEALIDDLESAEESLSDAYDDAISRTIDTSAKELLESQRLKIHKSSNRLEDLRSSLRS